MKVIKSQIMSNGMKLHMETILPELGTDVYDKLILILTGDGSKGSKSSTWLQLVPALVNIGVGVVTFDFYGLGESQGEYANLTLTKGIQNLRDVLAYINEHIRYRRLGAIGASFGGCVLLNSVCTGYISPEFMIFKSPASKLYEAYEHEQKTFDALLQWKKCGYSDVTGQSFNAYLDALQYDLYSRVGNIKCDTLVFHGSQDSVVPIEQSFRLSVLNPRIHICVLKGVDHDYKQNNAMEAFLSGCVSFIANY